MKQLFKALLKRTLAFVNAFPTGMTSRAELQFLLENLYPLSTNRELVRLGPNGDGGYLVPDDLDGIDACFSPGVSFVSGFEKDCARLGMKAFLADKSVEKPSEDHELFYFTQKFIGAASNDDFITLDDWVTSSLTGTETELLLQIDIEGYEYEVFLSASDHLMRRFRIIVAEFHQLDQLWNRPFFILAKSVFEKILQTHVCVHLHPNNCCGSVDLQGFSLPRAMEFTFLRKDRIQRSSYRKDFPDLLDFDNSANPPLILPKCWRSEK